MLGGEIMFFLSLLLFLVSHELFMIYVFYFLFCEIKNLFCFYLYFPHMHLCVC